MTLKDKFGEIWVGRGTFEEDCEKIADNYAIEFAKWVDEKYYQHKYDNNKYAKSEDDFNNGKTYNIKQLLEIFKKEK
jgi:hypothetical protein